MPSRPGNVRVWSCADGGRAKMQGRDYGTVASGEEVGVCHNVTNVVDVVSL